MVTGKKITYFLLKKVQAIFAWLLTPAADPAQFPFSSRKMLSPSLYSKQSSSNFFFSLLPPSMTFPSPILVHPNQQDGREESWVQIFWVACQILDMNLVLSGYSHQLTVSCIAEFLTIISLLNFRQIFHASHPVLSDPGSLRHGCFSTKADATFSISEFFG